MKKEIEYKAGSAWGMLLVCLVLVTASVFAYLNMMIVTGILLNVLFIFLLTGFMVIDPNESKVLLFFGTYKGTARANGFFWVNPFFSKTMVSLRARNLNGQMIKVNDKLGNPIEIAAVVVWQIEDTAKAIFEVNDYIQYITIQSDAAVRHLANTCPYDNLEDNEAEITLRGTAEKVNNLLELELSERLSRAGIKVIEARISHLAYAPEIAQAMLQRQQATAVVAARQQIVEGAVGMVDMALRRLSDHNIVELDDERRASMVCNLLVVLCSEKSTTPVVNAGTLYH
jgi:regulator of protease activity HflC (stomatin/prohibitin superfamily)